MLMLTMDRIYDGPEMIGYVFTIDGGCICWRSTLHKCVPLSTTKGGHVYVAIVEATNKVIWSDKLVTEM